MGGKHLKKLRAEKSKVKLKKKNLPKGQNITNVTFQIKKIVTAEQFKKLEKNEPLSCWNLSLKDLLTRLNHYNYTSRLNGLINLKELLFKYPTLLEGPSLHSIITKILALLTDVEHKIRITAVKILGEVFNKLQNKSLIPFHDILNLYLDCAMTHREFLIQQDSLKLIDVVIKFAPDAIKKNSNAIICNFTRILVNYKYGYHSDSTLSKKSRQDLENLKSDLFIKFYQLLKITFGSTTKADSSIRNFSVHSMQCRFNLKKLNNDYQKCPDLSNLFKQPYENEYVSKKSESSVIQNQISIIMPILFDTWLELGPGEENNFSMECILNKNKGLLLKSILKIILVLHEEIIHHKDSQLKNWFVYTYGNSFLKTFMVNFPYKEPFFDEIKSSVSYGGCCVKQNLILCYLFHCFKIKNYSEKEVKVENYVLDCLNLKNFNSATILPKVVELLLNYRKKSLHNDLLVAIIKIYDSTKNVDLQDRLFDILLKELFENKDTNAKSNQFIVTWKMSLPKKLLENKVPLNIIKGILQLLILDEGNEMLEQIERRAHEIIKAVASIEFDGTNSVEKKKMIAHLLYRCKSEVLQEILEKELLEQINPEEIRNYFLSIFSYKVQMENAIN